MKPGKFKLICVLINLMVLFISGFETGACNNNSGNGGNSSDSRSDYLFSDCGEISMDKEYMYIPDRDTELSKGPDICIPVAGVDRQIRTDVSIGQEVNMVAVNCQAETNMVYLSECRLFETIDESFPLVTAEGLMLIYTIPALYFPDGCYVDKIAISGYFRLNCNGSYEYMNQSEITDKMVEWEIRMDLKGDGTQVMFIPSNLTPEFHKLSLCEELKNSDAEIFGNLPERRSNFSRLKCDEYLGIVDVYKTDIHLLSDTLNFMDRSNEMVRVIQKGDQISDDTNCFVDAIATFLDGPQNSQEEFDFIHVKCCPNGDRTALPYDEYFLNKEGIEAALNNRPIQEMKIYYR